MSKGVLFLGPRFQQDLKVGGIIVLFEDLMSYCDKNKVEYKCIDTNLSNYSNKFYGLVSIIFNTILQLKKVNHISLHGTAKDYLFLAPFVIICSKLFNKKSSLRKFAGSFYEVFEKSNYFKKVIYTWSLKSSDYNFFETKFLVDKFKELNINTFWLPNSRPLSNYKITNNYNKKFVFISQVKRTKGIYEFMNASIDFDDSYIFDVYGPIMDENFKAELKKYPNVNYKGILKPDEVINTLLKYNVLLLPTYHDGEGYPGVIIEAFSIGMPVISTNWNAIPEIIEDKNNGLLIPVKNIQSLVEAIDYFDEDNFGKFSINAINSFDSYDSEKVNLYFFKKINLYTNA